MPARPLTESLRLLCERGAGQRAHAARQYSGSGSDRGHKWTRFSPSQRRCVLPLRPSCCSAGRNTMRGFTPMAGCWDRPRYRFRVTHSHQRRKVRPFPLFRQASVCRQHRWSPAHLPRAASCLRCLASRSGGTGNGGVCRCRQPRAVPNKHHDPGDGGQRRQHTGSFLRRLHKPCWNPDRHSVDARGGRTPACFLARASLAAEATRIGIES